MQCPDFLEELVENMKMYPTLSLNGGVTDDEIAATTARKARLVNRRQDVAVVIRTATEVGYDRIIIRFAWPVVTTEENRVIQACITDFVSNGFRRKIRVLLCGKSNWPSIRIRRNGRMITNNYSCIITAT